MEFDKIMKNVMMGIKTTSMVVLLLVSEGSVETITFKPKSNVTMGTPRTEMLVLQLANVQIIQRFLILELLTVNISLYPIKQLFHVLMISDSTSTIHDKQT